MKLPVIIVNFKTYEQVLGQSGLTLARTCEQVANESGKSIAIAPQNVDVALTCRVVNIPVLAQHMDNADAGSFTGHVSPQSVKAVGAIGSLINHSEHKIPHKDVKTIIEKCKAIGLTTVVCADDLEEAKALATFKPDLLAVEPPELIGGDISVTSAKPEIVSDSVKAIKDIDQSIGVLCGAGVKTGEDVKKALELGTVGVLLASGVVKARDPWKALLNLAEGLK
jgi:triosephosphate isomerase